MGDEDPLEEKTEISDETTMNDNNSLENAIEQEKIEQEILRDNNLLVRIVDEVHKEGLVNEEKSILVLLIKIFLRLVLNASATSSNVLVSDKTGSGKDVIVFCVCITVLPEDHYHHRTDISDKAFDYWQPIIRWEVDDEGKNIPIKDSWNGHVIHLEDPKDDALTGQSFRVMASGGTKVTKVINLVPVTITIDGKPVIIVTSLHATIDEEGQRRWDSLRIDTSDKLTVAVKKKILQRATGKKNQDKDDSVLHAIKHLLSPYNVVIPFAEELNQYLPNTLIMRTQTKKLLDYIKASAILYQWQREKDEQGQLIATWFDYDYARFVFTILKDVEGVTLNSVEEEFIMFLREQNEPISIKSAVEKFKKRSNAWVYDHLDSFVSKGLIEISFEQDSSNRDIKKIRATKGFENFDLPSSLWFSNQFQQGVEKDQQKDFQVFQSFSQIVKILDENREKVGLPPVFQDWYDKSVETQETLEGNTGLTEGNNINNDNKKGKEPVEKLHEKILKLKKTIEDNRKAGYKINDDFLTHIFDENFIQHCKDQGLLIKNGGGEYDFHWR
jgi:hypothetical protein